MRNNEFKEPIEIPSAEEMLKKAVLAGGKVND